MEIKTQKNKKVYKMKTKVLLPLPTHRLTAHKKHLHPVISVLLCLLPFYKQWPYTSISEFLSFPSWFKLLLWMVRKLTFYTFLNFVTIFFFVILILNITLWATFVASLILNSNWKLPRVELGHWGFCTSLPLTTQLHSATLLVLQCQKE